MTGVNAIFANQKKEKGRKCLMAEIYGKMVFLSEESEKEWNDQPESIKKAALHIFQQNIAETQWKIEQEMEAKMLEQGDNHCIEFWRRKAADYEWLFIEQRDISAGYRKIIEELREEIKGLKLKKSFDKTNCTKVNNVI